MAEPAANTPNLPMLRPFSKDDIVQAMVTTMLIEAGIDPSRYKATFSATFRQTSTLSAAVHITAVEPLAEPAAAAERR